MATARAKGKLLDYLKTALLAWPHDQKPSNT
jgi:hypothetical protein